jgi:hypothetical protein
MTFSIELPLNQTGLGSVGMGIAVELFKRGLTPNIFIIGNPDFGYANLPEGFPQWFQYCSGKALTNYKKSEPAIKVWHINGSQSRLSDTNTLYTVHEIDSITDTEKNIMAQYSRILVPSNFSKQTFEAKGLQAGVTPNFFDASLFSHVDAPRKGLEDVTIFSVLGKLEKRKWTTKTIGAWVKRFGGDKKYRLHCHVFNPFIMGGIDPKNHIAAHKQIIEREIGRELPWNVNLFGFLTKEEFNQALNVIDIDLGLSGGEGFGLPLLQTRCLGKRGVVLRAHAHTDYCSDTNSIFVEPSGKEDATDGMFFQKGQPYNQGNIFTWDEDAGIAGMEQALNMDVPDPEVGKALADKFSVKNTVDCLLDF